MSSALIQKIHGAPGQGKNKIATSIVAVSCTSDSSTGNAHRARLNSAYIVALENAGLVPLIVPPLTTAGVAERILASVDGLVLTGGEDVDPARYGQERTSRCGVSNLRRDDTEIALILAARALRKPLLAICRGPQVLNVALGGTLCQDIPSQVPDALEHNATANRSARVHAVDLDAGSRLAHAMGATKISVNSLHHQSVLEVARGLKVTARAPDGIVEGIESDVSEWWAVAVQWHPEEMNDSPEPWDRGLFRAFANHIAQA